MPPPSMRTLPKNADPRTPPTSLEVASSQSMTRGAILVARIIRREIEVPLQKGLGLHQCTLAGPARAHQHDDRRTGKGALDQSGRDSREIGLIAHEMSEYRSRHGQFSKPRNPCRGNSVQRPHCFSRTLLRREWAGTPGGNLRVPPPAGNPNNKSCRKGRAPVTPLRAWPSIRDPQPPPGSVPAP